MEFHVRSQTNSRHLHRFIFILALAIALALLISWIRQEDYLSPNRNQPEKIVQGTHADILSDQRRDIGTLARCAKACSN
jgi:hypothetical protein